MPTLKQCETQAMKLEYKERAVLAEHLIASLDDLNEKDHLDACVNEADRRYSAFKKGKISARDSRSVLHNAYASLKK
ncbi:MAG: addiction module protein [Fibrobacteres bacterium]|nr:addiction module protein [Fibrobacterota bacterium]